MTALDDVEMAEAVVLPTELTVAETSLPVEDDVMSFGSSESFRFSDEITLPGGGDEVQTISKPLNLTLLKECIEAGTPTLERIANQDVCLVLARQVAANLRFFKVLLERSSNRRSMKLRMGRWTRSSLT